MQRFRTKYKRFFLALFNKILKSNNICKRIILILLSFCIIDLIILNSNFYIFKIPHFVFILCGCILLFIVTLFKKIDTNNNKRLKKRKNYSELIATFILVFFTGYLLFINDCYSDFTKRKGMDFVSSDKLESLRNIEDFLINEKQIFIRDKINNLYYLKIYNNSYRDNAFLIVKMAENDILNQSIYIDLFPHKENLAILEKKLGMFLYCFLDDVKHARLKLEYFENSNLTKANIGIDLKENASVDKIKQTITNILLSTVQGLQKNNITINIIN